MRLTKKFRGHAHIFFVIICTFIFSACLEIDMSKVDLSKFDKQLMDKTIVPPGVYISFIEDSSNSNTNQSYLLAKQGNIIYDLSKNLKRKSYQITPLVKLSSSEFIVSTDTYEEDRTKKTVVTSMKINKSFFNSEPTITWAIYGGHLLEKEGSYFKDKYGLTIENNTLSGNITPKNLKGLFRNKKFKESKEAVFINKPICLYKTLNSKEQKDAESNSNKAWDLLMDEKELSSNIISKLLKYANRCHADSAYSLGYYYLFRVDDEKIDGKAMQYLMIAHAYGVVPATDFIGSIYSTNKYYAGAAGFYKIAAELGSSSAQYGLGALYYNGQGLTQNKPEAVKWFRKAAEQEFSMAQYMLGYSYLNGVGISQNKEQAVHWLTKAADQNHTEAKKLLSQINSPSSSVKRYTLEELTIMAENGDLDSQRNVGLIYASGLGNIETNYSEAIKWFRRAAERGDSIAQYNLGLMYDRGHGVRKNKTEAAKWYKKAADQGLKEAKKGLANIGSERGVERITLEVVRTRAENGHLDSQRALGIIYSGDKNYTEAVKWFRKAAERGDSIAQYNLGLMYYEGEGLRKNNEEAIKWFRKAADKGHTASLRMIKKIENESDSTETTTNDSLIKLLNEAKRGSAKAQLDLGNMFTLGKDVKQDYAKAAKWYRKAAEQGDSNAQFFLGALYELGKGVEKDYIEALKWYKKSSDVGNYRAIDRYKTLKKKINEK